MAELIKVLHEGSHEVIVFDHVVAVAALAHLAHKREGVVFLVGLEHG